MSLFKPFYTTDPGLVLLMSASECFCINGCANEFLYFVCVFEFKGFPRKSIVMSECMCMYSTGLGCILGVTFQ